MKEILFRGKRIDTGEWVEGSYLKMDECAYIMPPVKYTGITIVEMFVRVNPETVGQYTGLRDKSHLTKIFEGDIVRYGYAEKEDAEVVYDESEYSLKFPRNKYIQHGLLTKHSRNNIKVIGNVHDNPELLKGGES